MMKKFGDYAREAVFGMLWSRPGLDLKTKTLICVISDTAQARWPELAIHLRMARGQGWTEDELSEETELPQAEAPPARERNDGAGGAVCPV